MNNETKRILNAIRKQIRYRREYLGLTHAKLVEQIKNDFGRDIDQARISRIEKISKEENEKPDTHLDIELLYYIFKELDLRFDPILFQDKPLQLIHEEEFDNQGFDYILKIKKNFFNKVCGKKGETINFENRKIHDLYFRLLYSAVRSFIPPKISVLSKYASGSTSLIKLLLGEKLPNNCDSGCSNTYYIHKSFKPNFLPDDTNSFFYNLKDFTIESIFNENTKWAETKTKGMVEIIFSDSFILQYITILDCKFTDKTPYKLFQNSFEIILLSSYDSLDCKELARLIESLNEKFGINSNKYIIGDDFLRIIKIFISKNSRLKEIKKKQILQDISESIDPQKLIRLNLKKTLGLTVLKKIWTYDLDTPESFSDIKAFFEKTIKDLNNTSINVLREFVLPISFPMNSLNVLDELEDLYHDKALNKDNLAEAFLNYSKFTTQMKEFINDKSGDSFYTHIKDKIESFVEKDLNKDFFIKLFQSKEISHKGTTNIIDAKKDNLNKIIEEINNKTDRLLGNLIGKRSYIDTRFFSLVLTKENFYTSSFKDNFFKQLKYIKEKKKEYVNVYLNDITGANKPTIKLFLKRLKDVKNSEGKTFSESIIKRTYDILYETIDKYIIVTEKDLSELESYINLYKELQKIKKQMKKEIEKEHSRLDKSKA